MLHHRCIIVACCITVASLLLYFMLHLHALLHLLPHASNGLLLHLLLHMHAGNVAARECSYCITAASLLPTASLLHYCCLLYH
jgi:hypothetical protein